MYGIVGIVFPNFAKLVPGPLDRCGVRSQLNGYKTPLTQNFISQMKTRKRRELTMRRSVARSIRSTDTVIGENTDCSVHRTESTSSTFFSRTRVTTNTHATVKLKARLGLNHREMARANGLVFCVLRSSRNKTAPFVINGKALRHRKGNSSWSGIAVSRYSGVLIILMADEAVWTSR